MNTKMNKQTFIQTQLTESERTTFYPKQVLDENGLCMCADCLDCVPYKFRGMKKPRQCVTCECYNLKDIKTVDSKIYCLDCYEEEEEEQIPIKPRGVIKNCCFNCDEETTNKITVNKGKTNEREDFFCELCVLDTNEINKNKN